MRDLVALVVVAIRSLRLDLFCAISSPVMNNRLDLIQARHEMMGVLDEKFKNVPEWRAFRAIDRVLMAMNGSSAEGESTDIIHPPRVRLTGFASYVDLGVDLIRRTGKPVPTTEIVSFVAQQKNRAPEDIKTNVQSALSRDNRIESIRWSGGRGWWLKGQEVPK
jgi:hypothetical protein